MYIKSDLDLVYPFADASLLPKRDGLSYRDIKP